MQLRHVKTIHSPAEMVEGRFQKVTALAWSANNYRLAASTVDRYIILYDEEGNLKEKFPTKAAEKTTGKPNYTIRGMEFSPDSTKLAVAQSDNIVFIYKLGSSWADKKTICNKFPQTAPVTCLCWPHKRFNEVIYGLADGKVRVANLKTNKTGTLFSTDSYVVACAAAPDGNGFVSAHADGSIYKYTFADFDDGPASSSSSASVSRAKGAVGGPVVLTNVGFAAYGLAYGQHVIASGNSPLVKILDLNGSTIQSFNYESDERMKEFTSAAASPSGQTVVLGNFDRFITLVFNGSKQTWEEAGHTTVENLYSITAMKWKNDGSKLVTGSLCGAIDIYDACLRRSLYRGLYEFTYTSPSSLIIKRLSSGAKVSVKSRFSLEIQKVNIYQERFFVAHTVDSLIIGDMSRQTQSEVQLHYTATGKEKFYFDNDYAAMIYHAGELHVVEYGQNEFLGSVRTEFMSPFLISLRVEEMKLGAVGGGGRVESVWVKKIAYLLDSHTIRVYDFSSKQETNYSHTEKIDWLELNPRGSKLLIRDKKRALLLFDTVKEERSTLLPFCAFVQWVPDSDVVVAQNRRTLCVWYNIAQPDDMTSIAIKGDIEEIERAQGKTEVIVDEGVQQSTYLLDEGLIAFGSAMDAHDFHRAVAILEKLPMNSLSSTTASVDAKGKSGSSGGPNVHMKTSAEALWTQLSRVALEEGDYIIAERCFSALGDLGKTRFLNKLNAVIAANAGNREHYLVRALISMLNKQPKRAQAILLQQGNTDEAIAMYRSLHKWKEAIALAESKNHPQLKQLRQEYFQFLLNTKQEEVAGDLKVSEKHYDEALHLYLKGGFPAKAADLILQQQLLSDTEMTEQVANALLHSKAFEKAGEFFSALRQQQRALDAYRNGHAYYKAVELAKIHFASSVVSLEEEWGDYLYSQKQMDGACNHYIQAGAYLKAINAAIEARQWAKAVQILDNMDPNAAKPFFKKIAMHFAETKKYADAEKYFNLGGFHQDAVQMYTNASMWDKAHAIAIAYMNPDQVRTLYVTQGQKMEAAAKYKDAERLYVTVDQHDLAINMYQKNRLYDDYVRLVAQFRKDRLPEAHVRLAQQFEQELNFKLAEQHFLKAKEWKQAANMYKEHDMWEDALRIAKAHGGQQAYKQYAYMFAMSVGGEAGLKMLAKRGLAELAVEYALERNEYQEAFRIADGCCKQKLPEVHLQYALSLEDEGQFLKAEEEFIKAKKPKEAVDMYIHQQEWEQATRVAEQYEPSAVTDIYIAQAKQKAEAKNYGAAESMYLLAKKPEALIKMYEDANLWDDAIRIAKAHQPSLLAKIQTDRLQSMQNNAPTDSSEYLMNQAKLFEQKGQFSAAIDSYLKLNSETVRDIEALEQAWADAVQLAANRLPQRVNEVVNIVGKRLFDLGRFENAANVYLSVGAYKEAIDSFLAGKLFDRAKRVAEDEQPSLRSYVEKSFQEHLIKNDKLQDLGAINPDAAIEMHVGRGEWKQVYELAAKQGEDTLQKYAALHAAQLAKDGKFKSALSILHKHGTLVSQVHFELYRRIAKEVLMASDFEEKQLFSQNRNSSSSAAFPTKREKDDSVVDSYLQLREMLYKLYHELSQIDPNSANTMEFERLLFIAHLLALKNQCESLDLKVLSMKQCVSLLRYTTDVPVDKAFYDAGLACRDHGALSNAFVVWNRFVDVIDKLKDPDSGDIDNTDFLNTDIPPPDSVPMPSKAYYPQDIQEEAREWVLEKAMSNDIDQALVTRPCEKCGKEIYEASLKCFSCKTTSEPCCVTGFPIDKKKGRVQCKTCNRAANKDDWNKFVAKTKQCPWCSASSQPQY